MRIPQSGLVINNPAWPLLQTMISYWGTTDAIGDALGLTLIDSQCGTAGLQPSYVGQIVKVLGGGAAGQVRIIDTHNLATGTIAVVNPWTDSTGVVQQIAASTDFVIIPADSSAATISLIFNLVNALLTLTETGGSVTATGLLTEDNVYINNAPAGVYRPILVTIDMSDLAGGEVATVRARYRIAALPAALELKGAPVIFNGVQAEPLKDIGLEPNRFGVQVTIEATAAVIFPWEVHYEG